MARLISAGFPGNVPAPPAFPHRLDARDVKKCSCITVNGAHNADPRCQVHSDNPAKAVFTMFDAETGEVDRHYCG